MAAHSLLLPRPNVESPGTALFSKGFRPFFLLAAALAALAVPAWLLALRGGKQPGGELGAMQWHAHEMLFDFTATEEVLGKPVASDLRDGKLTLPTIFLMQRGGAAAREKVAAVLEDGGFERVSRDELVRLAWDSGAIDEARRLAADYAKRALADLAPFERTTYREALAYLPEFLLARDR